MPGVLGMLRVSPSGIVGCRALTTTPPPPRGIPRGCGPLLPPTVLHKGCCTQHPSAGTEPTSATSK